MYALGGCPLVLARLEMEPDVNSSNDQDLVLGLDFTDSVAGQPIAVRLDVARLQRAPEGPGQSTGGGRDHVVERRGTRLERPRRNPVMLGHGSVDAKDDRLRLPGKVGSPERALHALDTDFGAIHDSRHDVVTRSRPFSFKTSGRNIIAQ
jgi:hypothetical protein